VSDVLRVSDEGLQVLATHCDVVSTSLAASTPAPSAGPISQATSGAVGTAHVALGEAIRVLAGRAQASAVKAGVASTEFAVTDGAGAQQIGDVGSSISRM
jgi:hypothetical protein